ncbi:MAG: T9SS type A sorting domain-containing protein [Bacteroidales bacterium]|nr:T9SS type A sorting domain-containing protein [Bacteroidales bacterium]
MEVIDMQGRTMLAVPSTKQTLDISHLAAGNYAVRLTTPRGTAVRRLQVK